MKSYGMRKLIPWLGLSLLFLFTIPIFFDIYREAAFNITPRDDYAPYLQYLIGHGGEMPSAPYVYRLFSVAIAIPFYYLLPAYTFSNLAGVDTSYLMAVEALSAVSYLSIVLTAVMIFFLARRRYGASPLASLVTALTSILLMEFVSRIGIDPLAVLMIAVLLYWIDRPWIFSLLIFVAIGINEKILFLFALLTFFRVVEVLLKRRKKIEKSLLIPWMASWAALAGYFLVRAIVPVPGFENQINPATYWDNLIRTLRLSVSIKGLIQNGLPIVICAILAGSFSFQIAGKKNSDETIYGGDGIVFLAFLLIALVIDLQYTAGRVVMFTFPLYLPAMARLLDACCQPASSSHG